MDIEYILGALAVAAVAYFIYTRVIRKRTRTGSGLGGPRSPGGTREV